jgi:hypothetical protein
MHHPCCLLHIYKDSQLYVFLLCFSGPEPVIILRKSNCQSDESTKNKL